MKQGTHTLQLVKKRLKPTGDYFMPLKKKIKTCRLVQLERFDSYLSQKVQPEQRSAASFQISTFHLSLKTEQRVEQQGVTAALSCHRAFHSLHAPRAGPAHQRERDRERNGERARLGADRRPPSRSKPHQVLVIALAQRGWYLFLHEPQLIAQVVVGFHEVLDLGLGGGERVFQIHVFLHGDGTVGEVRVQTLERRKKEWRQTATFPPLWISFNVSLQRAQFLISEYWRLSTLVRSALLDGRSWSVSSSDATLS